MIPSFPTGLRSRSTQAAADGSGIVHRAVEPDRRDVFCLDTAAVVAIARGTQRIRKVYSQLYGYDEVDTEFAVADGRVFVLQSRPVVAVTRDDILTVDAATLDPDSVILTGAYALPGAVTGRCKGTDRHFVAKVEFGLLVVLPNCVAPLNRPASVFQPPVIERFEDLVEGSVCIEADDIIFTAKTANYWNQYLTDLRAVCTQDGGPTAHPMLIGRERGLPVVCGVPDMMARIAPYDGREVTIDGLRRKVYLGRQPLRQATEDDLEGLFRPQQETPLPDDAETLNFPLAWGRVKAVDDGTYYVFNPNWEMSPAWRRLTHAGYPRRFAIINACRDDDDKLAYVSTGV